MSSSPLSSLAPGANAVQNQGSVTWSKSGSGGVSEGNATWSKSSYCPQAEIHGKGYDDHHHHGHGGTNWAWIIIVFIIIVVIIWLLLFAFKPTFVQKKDKHGQPTGEVDNGLACLWAVIIAIVIVIIIWIIKLAASY